MGFQRRSRDFKGVPGFFFVPEVSVVFQRFQKGFMGVTEVLEGFQVCYRAFLAHYKCFQGVSGAS